MSPYPRPTSHRRRSLSASASASPSTSRRIIDEPWRPSTKRTHPHCTAHSPSCKEIGMSAVSHKWDVEVWRRGKRPRMDRTPSPPSMADMDIEESSQRTPSAQPRRQMLPSTSAAFNFFPARPPRVTRASRTSLSSPPHPQTPSMPPYTESELTAIQASAFYDLHRSIAEGGEGFVQRMRAWESARTRTHASTRGALRSQLPPSAYYRRGRSSPTRIPIPSASGSDEEEEDDDDDVQILSGDSSSTAEASSLWDSSPPKKRARSLGQMDLDSPRSSPPPALPTLPPALSHTVSSSTNSSLVSLPLAFSVLAEVPASASREEKAVAALNLALASGAAGLNDYGAVREALGTLGAGAGEGISEVGEMWH